MEVARRLYLYVIAAITLGMLVAALITLANIALEIILGSGGGQFVGFNPVEQRNGQLALTLATIGVALPVWALHWGLAQRSAGRADAERRSAIRALYLAAVMVALLLLLWGSGRDLIAYALNTLFGSYAGSSLGLAEAIASLIICGGFWVYHAVIATRDARGPMSGAAAWLPRLYRYLAALIGLVTFLVGVVDVISLAGEVLSRSGGAIGSVSRSSALAAALTKVVLGAVIWGGHGSWSNRVARREDTQGHEERTARSRYGYLALIIFGAVSALLQELVAVVRGALSLGLGGPDPSSTDPALAIVGALVLALVFGAVWLAHRRFMIREAGRISEALAMSARRVDAYIVALLGLALGGGGLAWLIGKAIAVAFSSSRAISGGGGNPELATFLSYTLVGSLAWLAAINVIGRWRSALGLDEARSTARRAYLLLAIAGAVLSGLSAMVLLLNRLFGSILGAASPSNVAVELATPIGVLVMALLIAGLHYRWLQRDQREVAIERTSAQLESTAAVGPAEPTPDLAAPAAPPAQRRLVVIGPAGADLGATVAALRGALPEGFSLEDAD